MVEDDMENCVKLIDKHCGDDIDHMISELPKPIMAQLTTNLIILKSFAMSIVMQLFLREKIVLKEGIDGKKR